MNYADLEMVVQSLYSSAYFKKSQKHNWNDFSIIKNNHQEGVRLILMKKKIFLKRNKSSAVLFGLESVPWINKTEQILCLRQIK
jgi:hypothetical protein